MNVAADVSRRTFETVYPGKGALAHVASYFSMFNIVEIVLVY